MLSWLISRLPSEWIRWIGRQQFKYPLVGPMIGWVGRKVLASEGVIRYGVGAGLRFDAQGGTAGFLFGTAEPEEQAALERYLRPGGVFYDIGANVGFFATLAARLVGSTGKVYAFEPNPACAARVRRNAELNSFSHLEVVEAAVSRSSGRTHLHLGVITGGSSIVGEKGQGAIEVAQLSIDDFRARGSRGPTLVMIDAEGAEIDVLEGMSETIRSCRPVIMCEVHWIGDLFLKHCRQHLVPLGYAIRSLTGEEFPATPARFHVVLEPTGDQTPAQVRADAMTPSVS